MAALIRESLVRDFIVEGNEIHVRAIIAMAHSLDMTFVAWGVEHREVAYLKSLNCDLIQGWYFGEALPA